MKIFIIQILCGIVLYFNLINKELSLLSSVSAMKFDGYFVLIFSIDRLLYILKGTDWYLLGFKANP